METIFNLFLILHIASGALGLIAGTITIARKKGDRNHKLTGKLFAYGMLTAGASALVLSSMHLNYFLFTVGVFTIYLIGTGNRYIHLKMLDKNQKPVWVDWALTAGMMVAVLLFIALGTKNLINKNSFGVVYIVFGALGSRFVKTDIDNYKGGCSTKNYWLLTHLQRMTGGYIAALTAFLVVNGKYLPLPPVLLWLLPTIIFTPLIVRWSRKYKKENIPVPDRGLIQ